MRRTTSIANEATRILFFTGKGGVGKTSLACATALALSDAGKRVLLVSTDPASNLDEVLQTHLGSTPSAVNGACGLFALNIDPEAAARAYRERVVGPFRGILPEASIVSMEEQLSGACTVEIAAFDQFTRLLAEPAATGRVRSRDLRHSPDGSHVATAEAAGRLDWVHGVERHWNFMPRTAFRPSEPENVV